MVGSVGALLVCGAMPLFDLVTKALGVTYPTTCFVILFNRWALMILLGQALFMESEEFGVATHYLLPKY